jgi:hypothetical protein
MVDVSSGNVGIGTTSPGSKLHVVGDVNITGTAYITVSNFVDLNISRNLIVRGNITSKGGDFAEAMIPEEDVKPGEVVCFAEAAGNGNEAKNKDNNEAKDEAGDEIRVKRCSSFGDRAVAGVVSANPTIIGGDMTEKKVAVGIAGIVKTKVKGPIERFDMLTSSETPGYAEKASFGEMGTIIGKAMQSCESECEINVMVSMA